MDRKTAEAMVDILYQVQREVGYTFSFDEVYAMVVQTRRKADLNGKDDDYIPVLFENELKDLVMRNRIILLGRRNIAEKEGDSYLRYLPLHPLFERVSERA